MVEAERIESSAIQHAGRTPSTLVVFRSNVAENGSDSTSGTTFAEIAANDSANRLTPSGMASERPGTRLLIERTPK